MTPPITIVERTTRVSVLGHLDELERLMREFLDEMETRGHATVYGADSLTDWKFETFLQWLRQRERQSVAGATRATIGTVDDPLHPNNRRRG